MKYALWNNKGGVGKTFLSFVLATGYAKIHPEKQVVVIDMCPQANISEILLGGNGKGGDNLAQLISERQTVGGYFDERISSPHRATGNESNYLISVHEDYNKHIPKNLYLIPGDPSLELQVQTINNIAVQDLPQDSWKNVHSWIVDLENAAVIGQKDREVLFIIDCNPSFSSYTEQALLGAERLIVPCSPDGSSARAIGNISKLVYGHDVSDAYREASFFGKLKKYKMRPPKFHMTVLNRTTQYSERPSKAFKAMQDLVKENVSNLRKSDAGHDIFSSAEDAYTYMPDAHTVCIVCSSLGIPLYDIQVGKYTLANGISTQVNREPLEKYKKEVEKIIKNL